MNLAPDAKAFIKNGGCETCQAHLHVQRSSNAEDVVMVSHAQDCPSLAVIEKSIPKDACPRCGEICEADKTEVGSAWVECDFRCSKCRRIWHLGIRKTTEPPDTPHPGYSDVR
jgi:hypothetical protein